MAKKLISRETVTSVKETFEAGAAPDDGEDITAGDDTDEADHEEQDAANDDKGKDEHCDDNEQPAARRKKSRG